jgi:hypothetical protein
MSNEVSAGWWQVGSGSREVMFGRSGEGSESEV